MFRRTAMDARILMVEDEVKLAQFVQLELTYEGYDVSVAHDGLSGLMAVRDQFGFTKILGLGHSLWVPLLLVVLLAIPNTSGLFQGYLILWSGLTTVALGFDIVDVWTYFTS
jgi:CheY-like chemotaxis protein